MNISVFGMGYVGSVISACLARNGHHIIGVDINPQKVDLINQGNSPIVEPGLQELIQDAVSEGRLRSTNDTSAAIEASSLSFVCVGTPSQANGSLDLSYLRTVAHEIGSAIAHKNDRHIVCIRSTLLPGNIEKEIIPVLEAASQKQAGEDFGVCINPEFLREATAIYDFDNPPKTVIGGLAQSDSQAISQLYTKIDAPLILTDLKTASLVKYADNAFHALKLTFANEISTYAKTHGIDAQKAMHIFCQDKKLNISSAYLNPGFAYGGSCLPKDLRALTHDARSIDLHLPVLENIALSNQTHIQRACALIRAKPGKKIGLLGISFKAGTDDLRESPLVELCEHLIGKGYSIRIYDQNVSLAKLVGANKAYIEEKIPHLSRWLVDDSADIIDFADTIVIGNKAAEFADLLPLFKPKQHVIDLVRIAQKIDTPAHYEGLCWRIDNPTEPLENKPELQDANNANETSFAFPMQPEAVKI